MRRELTPLLVLASAFACLQWLRWPEPPGFDQSLFTYYGHWAGRGWALYRDLWDSKPPGLFYLYAVGERLAGTWHAARFLDALAAAASGALAFVWWRAELRHGNDPGRGDALEMAAVHQPLRGALAAAVAPWAAACCASLLPAAPCFGGPRTAGQPEVICTPLVLGALLALRHDTRRAAVLAGVLLGAASTLKLVAVFLLPLAWVAAPARRRFTLHHTLEVLAGFALPPLLCGLALAAQGSLQAGLKAVFVYPRAYAAELAGRIAVLPALQRAGPGLLRGLPAAVALALAGVIAAPRARTVRVLLTWLGLAMLGVLSQRQLVDYQLACLVPPLALLAAAGAAAVAAWMVALVRRAVAARDGLPGSHRMLPFLASLTLGAMVVAVLAVDLRGWQQGYAAHASYRGGKMSREEFVLRLGRPGLAWQEALAVRDVIASQHTGAAPPGTILVWGFAPAVYALSGLPPATRYAFHQTLLVEGSALSQRWPSATARRTELMHRLEQTLPQFVIVVSGDRSALEPTDSRGELAAFPALAALLANRYGRIGTTRSYEVLELRAEPR